MSKTTRGDLILSDLLSVARLANQMKNRGLHIPTYVVTVFDMKNTLLLSNLRQEGGAVIVVVVVSLEGDDDAVSTDLWRSSWRKSKYSPLIPLLALFKIVEKRDGAVQERDLIDGDGIKTRVMESTRIVSMNQRSHRYLLIA